MLTNLQIFRYAVPVRTVTKKHWQYRLYQDIVLDFGQSAVLERGKGHGQGHMTKFRILHPMKYL